MPKSAVVVVAAAGGGSAPLMLVETLRLAASGLASRVWVQASTRGSQTPEGLRRRTCLHQRNDARSSRTSRTRTPNRHRGDRGFVPG